MVKSCGQGLLYISANIIGPGIGPECSLEKLLFSDPATQIDV